MKDPLDGIKEMLSAEEKKQLKFSADDKQIVMEKITKGVQPEEKAPSKTGKWAAMFLTPAAILMFAVLILTQAPVEEKEEMAQLPYTKTLLGQYGDKGIKIALEKNRVQQINKSSEDKGIKVTVKEAYYDGSRIVISYSLVSNNKNHIPSGDDLSLSVNGKRIEGSYMVYGDSREKGNTTIHIKTIELKKQLPKKFTLGVNLQTVSIVGKNGPGSLQEEKGKWSITFPVEQHGNMYHYKPARPASASSITGEIKVTEINFSSSGTQVKMMTKPKGNADGMTEFLLFDDNGNPIKRISSGQSLFNKKTSRYEKQDFYEPLKQIPKNVTIIPLTTHNVPDVLKKGTDSLIKLSARRITDHLPLFIPQDKNGGLIVNKVEDKGKEIWVHYQVKGSFIPIRKMNVGLINDPGYDISEGIKEKDLIHQVYDKNYPEYGSSYNFEREFIAKYKIPYNKNLLFIANKQMQPLYPELTIDIHKKDLKK